MAIQSSKTGEFIALIYDQDGDTMGSLTGPNLESLKQKLEEAAEISNCNYLLLEVIDNYKSITIH
jgi:hypothetical protein